ncbi:MAG TPA: DUF1385 domain-containing protein [Solirubrobacterales bacterium]|nr:DUF1385 domain-containing protein [Solirubrobacterales bacterium]
MSETNGNRAAAPAEEERYVLRLGGMALRNGLLIHGPTSWAAAARDQNGEIQVASGPKPALAPDLAVRVPLLRGPLRLAEAFLLIPTVRMKLRAARLPFEDVRVIAAMLIASSASRALRRKRASAASELVQAALGLAPAMVALSDRNLAAYHGAEHKAIGAYEAGSDDPASATKEHARCGSNLVVPMLVLSAAGQLLLERALEEPGPIARAAVGVASASLAAEMFAWSERNPASAAARAFHRPGHEIQRLIATKEPTPEQLEVSVAALREILRVEQEAESESTSGDPLPAT